MPTIATRHDPAVPAARMKHRCPGAASVSVGGLGACWLGWCGPGCPEQVVAVGGFSGSGVRCTRQRAEGPTKALTLSVRAVLNTWRLQFALLQPDPGHSSGDCGWDMVTGVPGVVRPRGPQAQHGYGNRRHGTAPGLGMAMGAAGAARSLGAWAQPRGRWAEHGHRTTARLRREPASTGQDAVAAVGSE